jgi:hypothetical protein
VDRLEPITVLAVGLSGVLGDILRREASRRGGVTFVGEVDAAEDVLPALRRRPAELVLCALKSVGGPRLFHDVLREWPGTRVLAIEEDGRRASLYEMQPHRVPLGEVSASELVQLIHSMRRTQPAT